MSSGNGGAPKVWSSNSALLTSNRQLLKGSRQSGQIVLLSIQPGSQPPHFSSKFNDFLTKSLFRSPAAATFTHASTLWSARWDPPPAEASLSTKRRHLCFHSHSKSTNGPISNPVKRPPRHQIHGTSSMERVAASKQLGMQFGTVKPWSWASRAKFRTRVTSKELATPLNPPTARGRSIHGKLDPSKASGVPSMKHPNMKWAFSLDEINPSKSTSSQSRTLGMPPHANTCGNYPALWKGIFANWDWECQFKCTDPKSRERRNQ